MTYNPKSANYQALEVNMPQNITIGPYKSNCLRYV